VRYTLQRMFYKLHEKCRKYGNISFSPLSKILLTHNGLSTNSHLFRSIKRRCALSNFTQIGEEVRRVRVLIHLCPYIKYKCHCADFHETRLPVQLFAKDSYAEFNEDPTRAFSVWYQIRDKGKGGHNKWLLEFIINLMHNFVYSIIILHHDP
jgi:hypothetical protein